MRLTRALLVIVDISGYTDFITNRTVSLLHAEQIITELMETVIDRAEHPLSVNKLEGDAALLFREYDEADAAAATHDVLAQVGGFFPAFERCLCDIREARRWCSCDACANTEKLRLKAFVHAGEIAIKQVRQFQELAGEDVILIHRMLKNSVPVREYVLLSPQVRARVPTLALQPHRETLEGLGEIELWLGPPSAMPALPPPAAATPPAAAAGDAHAAAAGAAAPAASPPPPAPAAAFARERHFRHLPAAPPSGLRALWAALVARLTGA